MCLHKPRCPAAVDSDRERARTRVSCFQQGWSLLCNGLIVFEDTGDLLPDGRIVPPHRPQPAVTRSKGTRNEGPAMIRNQPIAG